MKSIGWPCAWLVLASAAIACAPGAPPAAPTPISAPATRRIVVFSDLHFDPFSDSTLVDSLARADVSRWSAILAGSTRKDFSPYGSDTNYQLFVSALAAMQRSEPAAERAAITRANQEARFFVRSRTCGSRW